jgi:hypothetical protein
VGRGDAHPLRGAAAPTARLGDRHRVGVSRLPDGLDDTTALDLSHEALALTRQRLSSAEGRHACIVSDVPCWEPARTYDAWHDRAVLHFLTAPADPAACVDLTTRALSPAT